MFLGWIIVKNVFLQSRTANYLLVPVGLKATGKQFHVEFTGVKECWAMLEEIILCPFHSWLRWDIPLYCIPQCVCMTNFMSLKWSETICLRRPRVKGHQPKSAKRCLNRWRRTTRRLPAWRDSEYRVAWDSHSLSLGRLDRMRILGHIHMDRDMLGCWPSQFPSVLYFMGKRGRKCLQITERLWLMTEIKYGHCRLQRWDSPREKAISICQLSHFQCWIHQRCAVWHILCEFV